MSILIRPLVCARCEAMLFTPLKGSRQTENTSCRKEELVQNCRWPFSQQNPMITVRTTPSQTAPKKTRNNLPTLQTCGNRSTCIYVHHGIQILPQGQRGKRIEQHASTSFDDKRHRAKQEQTHTHKPKREWFVGRLVGTEQKLLENPICSCILSLKMLYST